MATVPPPPPPGPPGPPPGPTQIATPAVVVTGPPLFNASDFNMFSQIGSDNLFTPRTQRAGQNPGEAGPAPAPDQIMIAGQQVQIRNLAITDYSPEWWFLYLWKEASARIGTAGGTDRQQIIAFFNRAFIRPPSFGLNNKWVISRGYFLTGAPALFAPDELRDYLTVMLTVGFDWVALGTDGSPMASSNAMLAYARTVDRTVHYQLVWRGESRRGLSELRQGGYEAQARDAARSVTLRSSETWHPFSNPDMRSKLWYRTGQNDNCLYSTISVATDWRASACFPKIEQTTDLSAIQAAVVNQGRTLEQLRAAHPTRIGEVLLLNGKREVRLITTSKVALMAVDGLYMNTKGRQEDPGIGRGPDTGYPEIGANSIAGSNVFAMAEFVRVHHGVRDADGFTLLTRQANSKMVTRNELLAAFADQRAQTDYYAAVELAFKDATKFLPRGLRWMPTGFEAIDPMKGIREVSLEGRRVWPA